MTDKQREIKRLYAIEWRKKNLNYVMDFYHKNKDHINEWRRKNPYSIMSILKRNAKKRNIDFSITREEFIKWWTSQEQKCVYCDIPIERMAVADRTKKLSKRLSIDRIDNNKGYNISNIVLSCLKCNFIKSNLFTFEEMKEIGQKYIKPKWQ